jgi:hypothetical protein
MTDIVEVASGGLEIIEMAVQGPAGVDADHSGLLNLDADDHLQYHTDARGDARYSPLAHDHSGVYEPADADIQSHLASASNPHSVTAAQVGADATGTAAGLLASHESAVNPHPGYLTPTEGDAAYAAIGHAHSGTYDPAGTAASAVSAHAGGTGVHTIAGVTGLQGALDAKSATTHDHTGTYAPTANGVTNGDSHDHSGGDGAQISYASLSNLPTLGTAAATAATDYATAAHNHSGVYEASGAIATHAALTSSVHGISTYGASLVDDADAGTARTTLGLGTAATTAATDYAAASHAHAASAITSGTMDTARLGSGTANSSTYLRGDQTWAAAAGGVASDTHAATEKTTPVDADELPLVDSAASWVLKRLTWANVKATLAGVFPLLAGKSGGQTLVGGSGVTDKLVLQGTSENGTVTSTALQVNVGNNGNLTALTIANNGQLTLQGDATTDLPTYGSELLTSAGWTVNTGWTESPDDVFAHSSGTETLTHSATITNTYKYQIAWTITGRTAGSITIAVGGQSLATQSATGAWGPTTTDTSAFTITPTTDFNGTVSLVSLKRITAGSTPNRVVKNSAGTAIIEERGNSTSTFIGVGAGRYNTTGGFNSCVGYNAGYNITTGSNNSCMGQYAGRSITTGGFNSCMGAYAGYSITTGSYNSCVGYSAGYSITTGGFNSCMGAYAGYSITTGSYNSCVGYSAGYSITTGGFNSCMGQYAGYSITTGGFNSCVGYNAGYNITTGSNNNCMGRDAGRSITTGSYNNCMGRDAGRYHADGDTALTDPEYSIYIGYNARGKDNSDNNSVVIGGNAPIGLGANTTVIGTSATTLTRLFGNLGLGVDSPSASIHTIKTTEQLRLGYDATYYASFTVSNAGNLTITPVGGLAINPTGVLSYLGGRYQSRLFAGRQKTFLLYEYPKAYTSNSNSETFDFDIYECVDYDNYCACQVLIGRAGEGVAKAWGIKTTPYIYKVRIKTYDDSTSGNIRIYAVTDNYCDQFLLNCRYNRLGNTLLGTEVGTDAYVPEGVLVFDSSASTTRYSDGTPSHPLTLTYYGGNVGIGTLAPSAAIHTIKTTEQLRLGYNATYYASFTVSSAGNLTLTNTGTTIYTDKVIENTVAGAGIVLKSPDGTRYQITVANGGTLTVATA